MRLGHQQLHVPDTSMLTSVCRFVCANTCVLNTGALCSLSSLTRLRELRLGDVDGNNPEDIDTICNMVSRLTSLHMGYCPHLQVRGARVCTATDRCGSQQGHSCQAPPTRPPRRLPAGSTC